MIGAAVSSILGGAATKRAAQRLHDYARAELIKDGERLRALEQPVEKYDRLERKDFWNDPDRWEGIDDPWATKIWEVRRRDVIDVRAAPVAEQKLAAECALMNSQMQAQFLQNQHPYASNMLMIYQQSTMLSARHQPTGLGKVFGF